MLFLCCAGLWAVLGPRPVQLFPQNVAQLPKASAVVPEWKYATGGRVRALLADNSSRGHVFVLSEDRRLYRMGPEGNLRWRSERVPARVLPFLRQGPDDTLYAAFQPNGTAAFNPYGKLIWTVRIGSPGASEGDREQHNTQWLLCGRDGLVYVSNGQTLALYTHTGRLVWKKQLIFRIPPAQAPAVDADGRIWAFTRKNELVKISPSGIELIDRVGDTSMDLGPGAPSLVCAALRGIVIAKGAHMWLYSPAGEQLWQSDLYSKIDNMCMDDERIYVSTSNRRVAAIEIESGAELWNVPAPLSSVQLKCRATRNGSAGVASVLAVYTADKMHLYYAENGGRITAFDIPPLSVEPLLLNSGRIVCGAEDWVVYSFQGPDMNAVKMVQESKWDRIVPEDGEKNRRGEQVILEQAGRDEYRLLLDELKTRAEKTTPDKDYSEMMVLLERLAGVGVLNPVKKDRAPINDFPDIRARAVELLGRHGNLASQRFLLELLQYEWDTHVQLTILKAIRNLRSGLKGKVLQTLNSMVTRGRIDFSEDGLLTAELIRCIEDVCIYSGTVTPAAGQVLTDIYLSDAARSLRLQAIRTLRALGGGK